MGELRVNIYKIPTEKFIVVHCANGYRVAAGSSLINSTLKGVVKVYDLGDDVKNFIK